jgi:hypothetical protein
MDENESKIQTRLLHRKIAKSGEHYCFYIPPTYIRDEQLKLDKKYTVIIVEETIEKNQN